MPGRELGRKPVAKYALDMGSTPVTTGAWVTLIDPTTQPASSLEIFNAGGKILKFAKGAAASEVEIEYYILPGGSSILLPIEIGKGIRLSVKAVDGTSNSGYLIANTFA